LKDSLVASALACNSAGPKTAKLEGANIVQDLFGALDERDKTGIGAPGCSNGG